MIARRPGVICFGIGDPRFRQKKRNKNEPTAALLFFISKISECVLFIWIKVDVVTKINWNFV